jgi:hypothetical protein
MLDGRLILAKPILIDDSQPKVILVLMDSPDCCSKLLGRDKQHQFGVKVEVLFLLNFCSSEFVVVVHHHQQPLTHNDPVAIRTFFSRASIAREDVHLLLQLANALFRVQQQHTGILLRHAVLSNLFELRMGARD